MTAAERGRGRLGQRHIERDIKSRMGRRTRTGEGEATGGPYIWIRSFGEERAIVRLAHVELSGVVHATSWKDHGERWQKLAIRNKDEIGRSVLTSRRGPAGQGLEIKSAEYCKVEEIVGKSWGLPGFRLLGRSKADILPRLLG